MHQHLVIIIIGIIVIIIISTTSISISECGPSVPPRAGPFGYAHNGAW
jgi:hypothetical protein